MSFEFLPQLYVGLLLGGILLVGAEIYVPGAVLGVAGVLCLIGALVVGFGFGPQRGFLSAAVIVLASGAGLYWWIRFFPNTGAGRRLTLHRDGRNIKSAGHELDTLVGRTGTAVSALKPSGIALIDGRRQDVSSNGRWIAEGARVQVTAVSGRRIEVIPLDEPADGGGAGA